MLYAKCKIIELMLQSFFKQYKTHLNVFKSLLSSFASLTPQLHHLHLTSKDHGFRSQPLILAALRRPPFFWFATPLGCGERGKQQPWQNVRPVVEAIECIRDRRDGL